MSLPRPGQRRDFRGRVALIALLRVIHVVGVVGVGAGVLAGHPALGSYLVALVASGACIALLDAYANRSYFRQASGLAVLLKAGTLAGAAAATALGAPVFWTLLLFSVAIAHAPGRLRHRSLF